MVTRRFVAGFSVAKHHSFSPVCGLGSSYSPVGSFSGHHLLSFARGEHHPVLLALELRARKGARQADLHVAVLILIGMQGELSDNGHIADLEVHVMQFRTRKAVFHRFQLLRRDDDAQLLQLLKFEVRRIELDLFELVRGNRMLVQCLESLRIFRVVDEVDELLSEIAGLVGSDLEKTERLIAFNGLETLDESRGSTVIAQVVKGRLVGRERLRRSDLVTVVLFVEFGNRLYGAVLLVVEKKCFLVVGIGLFGCRNRLLILIFFGHKVKCF